MNPYDPPKTSVDSLPNTRIIRTRRGPALYIVSCGLLGGLGSLPFLIGHNLLGGLVVVLIGCVAGGLIYRFVSIDWPLDSSALRRQIIYSAIAVILPPMIFWFVTDEYGPRLPYTIIGLSVGGSVACGIFVAGAAASGLSDAPLTR